MLAEKGANLDVRNHLGETPYGGSAVCCLRLDLTLTQVCVVSVSSAAIADDPDIRQLVLELKATLKEANGTVPEDSGVDKDGLPTERRRSRSRR